MNSSSSGGGGGSSVESDTIASLEGLFTFGQGVGNGGLGISSNLSGTRLDLGALTGLETALNGAPTYNPHVNENYLANLISEMSLDPPSLLAAFNGLGAPTSNGSAAIGTNSLSNSNSYPSLPTSTGLPSFSSVFSPLPQAATPTLGLAPSITTSNPGNLLPTNLADIGFLSNGSGHQPPPRFCICEERHPAVYHCQECDDYLCEACKDAHRRVKLTRDHLILKIGQENAQTNFNNNRLSVGASVTDVSARPASTSNGVLSPVVTQAGQVSLNGLNGLQVGNLNGGNAAILFGILPLPSAGGHAVGGVQQQLAANLNRLNITFDGQSIGNGISSLERAQLHQRGVTGGRDYAEIMHNGPLFSFGMEGSGDGQLCRPWGICVDRKGRVIVADRSNNRIQMFNKDGRYLMKFGTAGNGRGQFNRPAGVCVNTHNHIIVADKDNHRIQTFTENGEFILEFGCRGRQNSHFNYPWGVATNQLNHIAVTDTRNHRVQIFDASGQFLRKIGYDHNYLYKNLDSPRGVVFSKDGQLMCTDFNNHRVAILPRVGHPNDLKVFGNEGTDGGQFMRPQGMAIDAAGNILVCDSKNNRIQVFTADEYRCIAVFGLSKGSSAVNQSANGATNGTTTPNTPHTNGVLVPMTSAPNSASSTNSSYGSHHGAMSATHHSPPPPLPIINASPPTTPPNSTFTMPPFSAQNSSSYDLPIDLTGNNSTSPFSNGNAHKSPQYLTQLSHTQTSPPSLFAVNLSNGSTSNHGQLSSTSSVLSANTTTTSMGSTASNGPGGLLPSSKTTFLNTLNGCAPAEPPPLMDRPTDVAIASDGRIYVVDYGHNCIHVF